MRGDVAHALTGETFGCIAGVNLYENLPDFLKMMKQHGTKYVYEAHDMEKRMETICCGDYNEKCTFCEDYKGYKVRNDVVCPKKVQKKKNIQSGCMKVAEFCRSLDIPVKTLTWDTDEKGRWRENIKGIDNYLFSLSQKN